jgi:hypothetical protein
MLEMAASSPDRYLYERKIAQRFGNQFELELVLPPPKSEPVATLPLLTVR